MKIIFNAREKEVDGKDIPYSKLCDMAGLELFFTPTITYYLSGVGIGGSVVEGAHLKPKEGMIVNVMMTNNA